MQATGWSDYLCPWAYLGRDRTALLREMGLEVTVLAYELHPEVPSEGREIRPGGRLSQVFDIIGAECAELGIDFTPPVRTPNTHRVLETAEVVRIHAPEAFDAFDESVARAHWVDGLDLRDRDLIGELVVRSGAPADLVTDLIADGAGSAALDASMTLARSRGVTATPSWWIADALQIPGAQPRDTMRRWVTKLRQRSANA